MGLLANWGLEILFGLISAVVIGYAKYKGTKLKKELENAKKYMKQQEKAELEIAIEEKTEPIIQEIESLRAYVRENEVTVQSHKTLIVDSYKFRFMQLCKVYLEHQYITQEQLDQIVELYKVYSGLGGNGQAKIYYDKVLALPLHSENE